MNIDSVDAFTADLGSNKRAVFIVLRTRDGLSGVGEASITFPHCLSDIILACIRTCKDFLMGQDATRISWLWANLYERYFWRGGPAELTVLGAIDQALWDIAGKRANMPVFQLLGGAHHQRIKVYHNGWWRGAGARTDIVENALAAVERGATALKWYPFSFLFDMYAPHCLPVGTVKRGLNEVAAVREAVGPDIDLMIDVWRKLDFDSALLFCREVAPLNPVFVEEPIFAETADAIRKLSDSVGVRIATGERLLTRLEFAPLIETRAVSLIQPDVPRVGGISEAITIARAAASHGIGVAPHNPVGSVGTAAAAQLCAAIPNFTTLERYWPFKPKSFIRESFVSGPDYIALSDTPGMGISLDEAGLTRHG